MEEKVSAEENIFNKYSQNENNGAVNETNGFQPQILVTETKNKKKGDKKMSKKAKKAIGGMAYCVENIIDMLNDQEDRLSILEYQNDQFRFTIHNLNQKLLMFMSSGFNNNMVDMGMDIPIVKSNKLKNPALKTPAFIQKMNKNPKKCIKPYRCETYL